MRAVKIIFIFLCSLNFILVKGQAYFPFSDTSYYNSEELIQHFNSSDALFMKLLKNQSRTPFQLIITEEDNPGKFKNYFFEVKPKNYFYPASLVKLPVILLACEKINELNIPEFSIYSPMLTDSAYRCQQRVNVDFSTYDSLPTLANYIKKMLLVSDNDAFNRLYEFLGYEYIQQKLKQKGYANARIIQRLEYSCDSLHNRTTNPVAFLNQKGDTIYRQLLMLSPVNYVFPHGKALVGKGYYKNHKLIKRPKDFANSNFLPLPYLHNMLLALYDSSLVDPNTTFNLTQEQKLFIVKYMTMFPRESYFPKYNPKEFPDNYKKHLFWGNSLDSLLPDSAKYANIIGRAYGFFSESGFVKRKNRKYYFSYVIFCSNNQLINRKNYEYFSVSKPMIREIKRFMKISNSLEK